MAVQKSVAFFTSDSRMICSRYVIHELCSVFHRETNNLFVVIVKRLKVVPILMDSFYKTAKIGIRL